MIRDIYASSCETIPNSDKEVVKENSILWIIEFTVSRFKGCAIVKANNAKEAESILRTNGEFNGEPYMYKINRIEEVVESPFPMLISEQIND